MKSLEVTCANVQNDKKKNDKLPAKMTEETPWME